MDSIVKKIQELDVSNPDPEGWHKRSSSGKADKINSGRRGPSEAGPENPTDSQDSSPILSFRLPALPSTSDTPKPGPSHNTREIGGIRFKDVLPTLYEAEEDLSSIDPSFICSVTAIELVYKCLGCLHYHDNLADFLKHLEQGWMQGFSCKVFYRKLRSMHESNDYMSRHRANALSRYKSQCSDPTLSVSTEETRKSSSTEDEKADRIGKWLQTVEIAELS